MDPFAARVMLSFLVGGLYAATLIWISEKYGTKIGGILTGIPTTVLIGLGFISLTAGNAAAHKAALIIPAMVGVSLILVYIYTLLMKYGNIRALLGAVAVWAIFALLFVNLRLHNLAMNIFIGVALFAMTRFAMKSYPSNLKATTKTLRKTYIARVIGAGTVIASAVVMARYAGPVWGGVFSAFPATFATTLFMLKRDQGEDFAKSVARQLPLANGSTMTFAVLFYILVIPAGLFASIAVAMTGSLSYAFLLLKLSHSKK
ncbi:MAG: hypothetical protein KIH63_003545 [Candidatus Saccharibacteria bacterium]|nr:hypothetical protein [Candidatus Saccharibacteria bacterium]